MMPHRGEIVRWSAVAAAVLLLALFGRVAASEALFRLDGLDYSSTDLPMPMQQALYKLRVEHHRELMKLIDGAALDLHLQEQAEAKGVAKEVAGAEVLAVAPPPEEQIREFFEQNKDRIQVSYEQAKPRIAQLLQAQAIRVKARDYVDRLREQGAYEPLLRRPTPLQVNIDTDGFPSKGNPQAAVTIVEFADYLCSHCARASKVLEDIVNDHNGRVRLVYRDFPISPEGVSRRVAEGAVCAQEQGRFWGYHDRAFARQSSLTSDSPAQIAKVLELDVDRFADCLSSGRAQQRVSQSRSEAVRLGVDSTPTIFVNGRRLVIEDLQRDVRDAVREILAEKASRT